MAVKAGVFHPVHRRHEDTSPSVDRHSDTSTLPSLRENFFAYVNCKLLILAPSCTPSSPKMLAENNGGSIMTKENPQRQRKDKPGDRASLTGSAGERGRYVCYGRVSSGPRVAEIKNSSS